MIVGIVKKKQLQQQVINNVDDDDWGGSGFIIVINSRFVRGLRVAALIVQERGQFRTWPFLVVQFSRPLSFLLFVAILMFVSWMVVAGAREIYHYEI